VTKWKWGGVWGKEEKIGRGRKKFKVLARNKLWDNYNRSTSKRAGTSKRFNRVPETRDQTPAGNTQLWECPYKNPEHTRRNQHKGMLGNSL